MGGGRKNSNVWKLLRIQSYYLTITLRARNFYEVIVNEGEAWVNYRLIEVQSE